MGQTIPPDEPQTVLQPFDDALAHYRSTQRPMSDSAQDRTELTELIREAIRLGRANVPERRLIELREELLKLLPEDARANNDLAWAFATARDIQWSKPVRAVELARKAVSLKPNVSSFHNTLGTALYRAGQWDESRRELERSLALRNFVPAADWYLLAALAHREGKTDEAQRLFDQAAADHQAHHAQDDDLNVLAAEVKKLLR